MNKKILKCLLSGLLITTFLTGCGNITSMNNSSVVELNSSLLPGNSSNELTSDLSSADADSTSASISSEPTSVDFVDYVNSGDIKLTLDYAGHDFYQDGIGQVSLLTPIDGDTAHFTPLITTTSKQAIKSRFYGIDTPESTGQVEPWGKPASNFTKEKLKEADANGTIVVATPQLDYGVPVNDTTGTRYLSLIWISTSVKNCPFDQLVLLNLWIVQEGFSVVKNLSAMPDYSDTFIKAQNQAEAQLLNMFSGKPDDLYNYGGYKDTSLLDLKKEIVKQIADPTYKNAYDNVKVRIQGTVAGYFNNTLYLQDYFPNDDGEGGEYAGINIYCSAGDANSKYRAQNTYIELCGLAQDSETFGFQITSVVGITMAHFTGENAPSVLLTAAQNTDEHKLHTFEYSPDQLLNDDMSCLYSYVSITAPVVPYYGFSSTDGDSITLYLKYNDVRLPYNVYVTFRYKPDPNNVSVIYTKPDQFYGQSFMLKGIYTYHRIASGSKAGQVEFQIAPCGSADLLLQADN